MAAGNREIGSKGFDRLDRILSSTDLIGVSAYVINHPWQLRLCSTVTTKISMNNSPLRIGSLLCISLRRSTTSMVDALESPRHAFITSLPSMPAEPALLEIPCWSCCTLVETTERASHSTTPSKVSLQPSPFPSSSTIATCVRYRACLCLHRNKRSI